MSRQELSAERLHRILATEFCRPGGRRWATPFHQFIGVAAWPATHFGALTTFA